MASKAAIVNREERPAPVKRQEASAVSNFADGVVGSWGNFTRFLTDVRAEMRKVVTPSRKEVQATTTVVIIAVFIFGVYFFAVDRIFDVALHSLLGRLGGLQK